MRLIDLTGNQYGKLTVLKRAEESDKFGRPKWECVCECGRHIIARGSDLRNGAYKSCGGRGCKQRDVSNNLAGQRFGRLTVIERAPSCNSSIRYKCKCDCGNECVKLYTHLVRGHVLSCGCLRDELKPTYRPISNTQKLRHTYEDVYGEIPQGFQVTTFNGDIKDLSKNNLTLISKAARSKLRSRGWNDNECAELRRVAIKTVKLEEACRAAQKNI